jgi:hypothetical protein
VALTGELCSNAENVISINAFVGYVRHFEVPVSFMRSVVEMVGDQS